MFKIHVVGTPATIAELSAANHCLTTAALDLATRRGQLRAAVEKAAADNNVEADNEIDRLHREFVTEAMRASMLYQRHLVKMNVSVRKELGLPLDEAQYFETSRQAEQKITTAIEQTIQPKAELPR